MKKILKIQKLLIIILFFTVQIPYIFASENKSRELEDVKKAIITIESRVPVAAYKHPGSWQGTGFIADKKNGYLVTNTHVVGRASIGNYYITFYNGQQTDARLVYYDEYVDFAILKIDPKYFPESITDIEFTKEIPAVGEEVFVVGNTEGCGFSFHSGHIADIYDISGDMPQGSYTVNMNIIGGASGSPVLNSKNKAIAVLYGGGKTYSLCLKGSYIQEALKQIQSGSSFPKRNHIGVITSLYSLDKAVKHRNFLKSDMVDYIKRFPDARNRVIVAHSILPGSTAESIIFPGDILWKINDRFIGADLTIFDEEMNKSSDFIKLTIIRNGQKLEKIVKLYDINKTKIKRMLSFAGGLFFESDDYVADKSGIAIGSVMLASVETGSSFSSVFQKFSQNNKDLYRIVIKSLNGHKINSLDDLIKITQSSVSKKYVTMEYINYLPYYPKFGENFISSQESLIQDITFDSIDTNPRILQYNSKDLNWISEEIR